MQCFYNILTFAMHTIASIPSYKHRQVKLTAMLVSSKLNQFKRLILADFAIPKVSKLMLIMSSVERLFLAFFTRFCPGVRVHSLHKKFHIVFCLVYCIALRTVHSNTKVFCPVFDYAGKTDLSRGY